MKIINEKIRIILKKKNLYWLFLFLFTIYIHISYSNNQDNGVIIGGAWNLINHKELYIDFFEFITPGGFYFTFLIWKIFGINYLAINLASIMLLFFSSIGIYKISESITKSKINYTLPFIFIFSSIFWPIINHNVFNVFFVIWATHFFIKGLEDYKIKNFIFSGLLTGLSILFLQHKGVVLMFSMISFLLFYLIKNKDRIYIKITSLYTLSCITPVLILLKWPIKLLYDDLFYFIVHNYSETNHTPLFRLYFFLLVISLYLYILIKNNNRGVYFLIYLQFLLLFATKLGRVDYFHTSLSIFPIYCLFPLVLTTIKQNTKIKIILYLSVLFFIFYTIQYNAQFFYKHKFWLKPNMRQGSDNILNKYIADNCPLENDVYFGPFSPQEYFNYKKINPTPYDWLITNQQTEEQFNDALIYLEKIKPKCAILEYGIVGKFKYDQNNVIDNYIRNNYILIFQNNEFFIYKKLEK